MRATAWRSDAGARVWPRSAQGTQTDARRRLAMKALFAVYLSGILLAIGYFAVIGLVHH